ncbi:MAG: hypothetical protein FD121_1599 [Gallionellaceae bacterium]|nr:MAG: hypothetical protein FD121_1599 [Gallionellaceae bacterium]
MNYFASAITSKNPMWTCDLRRKNTRGACCGYHITCVRKLVSAARSSPRERLVTAFNLVVSNPQSKNPQVIHLRV